MKTVLLTALVVVMASVSLFAQTTYDPRVVRIGNDVVVDVETPHPYNTATTDGYVFSKTFTNPESGFVRLHFKNFDLAPGDYVEVVNPATGHRDIYAGGGKVVWEETSKTISDFWANPVYGETAVVRLYSTNPNGAYGFDISEVGYGFSEKKLEELYAELQAKNETICGANDMDEAVCHTGTDMYTNARAVCRLLLNGSGLCTGWLVGSEGHVMTNNHCIGNSSTANNTTFLFDYEYSNCNGSGAQSGTVVANSSTLIKTSGTYDYTLVKLPTNPTGTYGYLTMSSAAASTGDRIYIPQHPGGVRKRIAVTDDQSPYSGDIAAIRSVSSNRIAYYADTEGGSSGSPVLDYSTNRVVVLHNTGSCSSGNGGIPIGNVINDLGSLVPANGVDGSGGGGGGGGSSCYEDATATATPYAESFEGGAGVWNQATCDDINWTRDSGGTPSASTGPSSGSDGSWYMYVEASNPNYPGKDADLYASFDLSGASADELTFDYHSYGTASDVTLRVDASTDGQNFTNLWSMTGNKGNQWNSVTVSLAAYANSTVTLRIAATTGSIWQGDVAIDNVVVGGSGSGGGGGTVEDCGSASNVSGSTGAWNYYTWTIPSNAVSTTVTTTGSNGDADLYVKFGSNPTTSDYLARSISSSSNESVTITSSGSLSIGVYAYAGYSGLTVGACNTVPEIAYVLEGGETQTIDFEDHIASTFGIYPNPVQDVMHLSMEVAKNSEVVIYTMTGAEMMRASAESLANGLNVSALPEGMYMLSLVGTKGDVITQRFVKQ